MLTDKTAHNKPDKDARHLYKQRSRFMARTLYKEGACHDFVRRGVMRHPFATNRRRK